MSRLRAVAADELWLNPCCGRATFALHFTWLDDDELVGAAVRELEIVRSRRSTRRELRR